MKRTIPALLLITAFTVMCAKADEPLGHGVSVDAQGNLVINAPLYISDLKPDTDIRYYYPELKKADGSFNDKLNAFINDNRREISNDTKIAEGSISGGRLSIIIPKPDNRYMEESLLYWEPGRIKPWEADWFFSGRDTKIGDIYIESESGYLMLYSNPQTAENHASVEPASLPITFNTYRFTYAEGSVAITGDYDSPMYHDIVDITLTEGWNTLCYSLINNGTKFLTNLSGSKLPSANAVWVYIKK